MAQRLRVVVAEALDVVGLEARALEREQHARERLRRAVGEDVARGEVARARVLWCRLAMPWLSSCAPGRSAPRRRRAYSSICSAPTCSTMPIEATASNDSPGELAVVGDAEVGAVADPGLLGAAARGLDLRRRERDAGDVDAVALGGVDGERAPAAADVEHTLAPLEAELLADQLVLGLLGRLERRRAAREDRARVGHRRAEEEAEELGRDVVVVAHGARVALDEWKRPLRRELGGGRRRRADRARGAERRRARVAPSCGGRSAGGCQLSTRRMTASRSSTSSAPLT